MISPWPPGTGPGTVSHGTLREADLIPRFLDVLRAFSPLRADTLGARWQEMADDQGEVKEGHEEDAADLTHTLDYELNTFAPEGFYFSTHEGDGSDFGFWEDDPDEG